MSTDFQCQYAHQCSLPYISYKMKCACIILDAIHQISLLIALFLSFSPFENERKKNQSTSSAQIFDDNGAILHAFDWLFEVTLLLAYQ